MFVCLFVEFLDETAQLTAVLNTMDTTSWNRGVRQSPRQLYQAALRGELEKTLAALGALPSFIFLPFLKMYLLFLHYSPSQLAVCLFLLSACTG